MSDSVLRIEGLRVTADAGHVLVDNVSVELARGEVVGLIGESGAGKSTIGLTALGYARRGCRITGGTIYLNDQDVLALRPNELRALRGVKVAYVAQSAAAAFNPALRIGAQVCEVARDADARVRMVELFRALELPEPERFGERYPHEASGGQLQRALVAMAVICNPDVVVLDEPTTALDVTTQLELLTHVKKLIATRGMSALYITHDLAVVAQVAHRIMILRDGKVVETGSTEEVLSHPATPYAQQLVSARRGSFLERHTFADSPLLNVENVTVRYGEKDAVKSVSLSLHRGETIALVGESGSGKTTLGAAMAGRIAPKSGCVVFDGEELAPTFHRRTKEQLRKIQVVLQLPDVAVNPRQTIGSIVGRPARFYFGLKGRTLAERVAELLSAVGLDADFAERYPRELSGGQKQRVCIARALAARPDVLICDEATSALDPLIAEGILTLLTNLQRELQLACLFITHDLETVRRVAHRTFVMLNGEIVAADDTARLFENAEHPYVAQLLESLPQMRPGWLEEVQQLRRDALASDRL